MTSVDGDSSETNRKPRRRLSWLALTAAIILVLSGAAAEVALRLWTTRRGESPTFVDSPDLGFRMRGDLRGDGIGTNSRGFNDGETAPSKGGPRRLAVIGDSFVFGVGERRDNLVRSLAAHLPCAESWEILNLGIPAAGPHTYRSVLENEAQELEADAVIIVFFVGNDIMQSHPDFRTRVFFGAPRELLRHPALVRPSREYFYVYRLGRALLRTVNNRRLRGPADEGSFPPSIFRDIEMQRAEVMLRQPPALVSESYAGALRSLADLEAVARRQGMPLFVVLAPDQLQVDRELQAELAGEGLTPQAYDLEAPQRRITESIAGEVEILDLLPAFADAARSQTLYRLRDSHWNDAGNDLAARRIADYLQRGWSRAPICRSQGAPQGRTSGPTGLY